MATFICKWCNGEYTPTTHNQKYCHECLTLHGREIKSMYERNSRRKRKKKLAANQPPKKYKTINDIVREMVAYNKKHGTHLTYGKYVEKMTLGLLKD